MEYHFIFDSKQQAADSSLHKKDGIGPSLACTQEGKFSVSVAGYVGEATDGICWEAIISTCEIIVRKEL